jgi:lactate dehydrogenase-like 2-hydroxyacid dehydrogenase
MSILVLHSSIPRVLDELPGRFPTRVEKGTAALEGEPDSALDGIRVIVCSGANQVDRAFINRFKNLELIANFGVGYDSVDAVHASTRGILVTHTPDVLTEEVADTALGLLIMAARELGAAERYLRAGHWEAKPYPLTPGTLRGRTVGLVGLGRIGLAIARRCEGFGLKLAYCNRSPRADVSYPYYPTPVALAAAVDTLMVVAPGGAATRHLINKDVLDALGPQGILINIGRGSVVDEAALIAALDEGRILSAGLDVFEDEPRVPAGLIAHEKITLLPHVGSASQHTRRAMGQLVVDNVVTWLTDRTVLTPVPETPVTKTPAR